MCLSSCLNSTLPNSSHKALHSRWEGTQIWGLLLNSRGWSKTFEFSWYTSKRNIPREDLKLRCEIGMDLGSCKIVKFWDIIFKKRNSCSKNSCKRIWKCSVLSLKMLTYQSIYIFCFYWMLQKKNVFVVLEQVNDPQRKTYTVAL